MKAAKIKVTAKHIDSSILRDSHHCMIADAIQDHLPHVKWIRVDLQSIRFTDLAERKRYVFLTPPRAQLALLEFDQGKRPEEFILELRDPRSFTCGWNPKGTKAIKTHAENVKKWNQAHPGRRKTVKRSTREREFGLHKFIQ